MTGQLQLNAWVQVGLRLLYGKHSALPDAVLEVQYDRGKLGNSRRCSVYRHIDAMIFVEKFGQGMAVGIGQAYSPAKHVTFNFFTKFEVWSAERAHVGHRRDKVNDYALQPRDLHAGCTAKRRAVDYAG